MNYKPHGEPTLQLAYTASLGDGLILQVVIEKLKSLQMQKCLDNALIGTLLGRVCLKNV